MDIQIKGGKKYQREYARSMIEFCQQKLMPRMQYLTLDVYLKDYGTKFEDYGFCHPTGNDGERCDRPRYFEIELHCGQKLRPFLETVAHEMVHVKQYAQSELYHNHKMWRWQGKWHKKELEYWEQPWEIEAIGREAGLFIMWSQHYNLGKKPWTKHRT